MLAPRSGGDALSCPFAATDDESFKGSSFRFLSDPSPSSTMPESVGYAGCRDAAGMEQTQTDGLRPRACRRLGQPWRRVPAQMMVPSMSTPRKWVNPWGCVQHRLAHFLVSAGGRGLNPPRHRLPDVSCSVDVTKEPNPGVADDATSFRRRNHVSCRRWHRQQGWLGRYPLFPIFFSPLSLPPSHPSSRSFHFFLEQKTGERRALLALMEPVTTRDCVLNIFPC